MASFFKEYKKKVAEKRQSPVLAIEDTDNYFNFNIPENVQSENPHFFMSEELLSPFANCTDTQRLNMFAAHIVQTVHLKNPEVPRVFTGFENQVGKYSVAYKKAPSDCIIINKIVKNPYCYTLIVKYIDGTYDAINVNHAKHITEEYGYVTHDCLENKKVGDRINAGEYIYKSDNYDDDGNFAYGTNLKAIYIPMKGMTYEDAFVITESGAKKLTSYKAEKVLISINTNDVLLNLYSDLNDKYDNTYHSIPKVGEATKGNILVASRRKEAQNVLYNFQHNKLREIDANDQVYYTCGGTVVDINVYSNLPLDKMKAKTDEFSQEITDLYADQIRYYTELAKALEEVIPALSEEEYLATLEGQKRNLFLQERKDFGHYFKHPLPKELNPNKYTDQLAYLWKTAHEYIDERIAWRHDAKKFDNVKLELTILKENPLSIGCKVTGRYGNKGVCAAIIPDDEAPYDPETGVRAEIMLNPLGVINRENPAQLYEQEINFIAEHVLREIKNAPNIDIKESIYLDFLKNISKSQYDFVSTELIIMSRTDKEAFFADLEENGIYVHEPPFVGNTKFETLVELYKIHPEWFKKYKCEGIERPEIIGDEYFIRLRHEASNKTSIRSKGMLNIKNLPSRSPLKKEKKSLINDNPIRFGEMETSYMYLTQRPDLVAKLLRSYSTSMEERQALVEQLLTADDPMNIVLEDQHGPSITREMLDSYLSVLELELED